MQSPKDRVGAERLSTTGLVFDRSPRMTKSLRGRNGPPSWTDIQAHDCEVDSQGGLLGKTQLLEEEVEEEAISSPMAMKRGKHH